MKVDTSNKRKQGKHQKQEYDNTLKALFGKEAKEILPLLVPEACLLSEENIEINRTMLRADLVYIVIYHGEKHILIIELQTSRGDTIERRLLAYSAALHLKYGLPVLAVILYPFEIGNLPRPPYRMKNSHKTLAYLDYLVITLWELDAPTFVEKQAVCAYTFLPGMSGVNVPMLKQALEALKQRYPHEELGPHLIRFHEILKRSTTLTDQQKRELEEVLKMEYGYDFFIDENTDVLERVEKGRAEGEARGELNGLRRAALNIVRTRFPDFVSMAQPRLEQITTSNELDLLIIQLSLASNEAELCRLLNIPAS